MKVKSIVQPLNFYVGSNDSLSAVTKLLEAEELTALPVIGNDGTLLGVITAQDVVTATTDTSNNADDRVVSERMKPLSVTCTLDDDVESLANQAEKQNYTHVAVVDDRDKVVGIADVSRDQERSDKVQHREEDLDEALEETFPASDPISPR